jgi:hypothetical protein
MRRSISMTVIAFALASGLGACADPENDNNGTTPTTVPGAITTTFLPGTTSTLGGTTTTG